MQNKMKFNKKTLSEIVALETRQRYYDTDVAGLVLEVSPKGKKSFRVYKRLKNQASPLSVTLGDFPSLTIEQARESARKTLNDIVQKKNPNTISKIEQLQLITMQEVFDAYVANKKLTDSTVRGYSQVMTCYLEEHSTEPLIYFDEETVKQVHKTISQNSLAQADLTMRLIRALFNFAKFEFRRADNSFLFEENPVQILSHLRAWHHVGRKQSYLNQKQLASFLNAIDHVRNEAISIEHLFPISVCDYVETALFTGLRKTELVMLKWSQVDLEQRIFWVDETKNGVPLTLPISDHLFTIFQRRHKLKTDSNYVFNANNNVGRIVEPKKVIYKISSQAELSFSLHDLRRTFTTVAERIQTSTYTLKRLLNHKSGRNDVTAGYTVLTPEELRIPAQAIEDKILVLAGRKEEKQKANTKIDIETLSSQEKIELARKLLASVG